MRTKQQPARNTTCPANVASDSEAGTRLNRAIPTIGSLATSRHNPSHIDLTASVAQSAPKPRKRPPAPDPDGLPVVRWPTMPTPSEQRKGSSLAATSEAEPGGAAAPSYSSGTQHGAVGPVGLTSDLAFPSREFNPGGSAARPRAIVPASDLAALGTTTESVQQGSKSPPVSRSAQSGGPPAWRPGKPVLATVPFCQPMATG